MRESTHPRDARRAARWRHAVAALLLIVAGPACAESNAAGSFETRVQKLDLTGAYAWWTRLPGASARGLRVAVSNAEFKPDLLDPWSDRGAVVREFFVNEQVKVVYFDFDADGRYRGYAYDFGGGDACHPCTDAGVRSTVRTAGGRIKGKVAAPGSASTAAFDVNFDVRVPERTWGTPLPADGGEPGRAYLAYHQALATGDIPALKTASDTRGRETIARYEQQNEARAYASFRWDERHLRMTTVTIVGGFVKGDRAVVLFEGSSAAAPALHGEAVLRREGGAWRVDDELVQAGARGS